MAVGGRARGGRVHRAGRGEQPRRRPLRAEHDDDQRRAARALGQRHRAVRRVGRLGPAVRGGRRRRRGRHGGGGPGRRAGGASRPPTPSPSSSLAQARPARDFGLDPEETDSGALEGVLSALSGAFGRARARDAVLAGLRGAGRGHAVSRQLHRPPALPRPADGGGQPGRAHGRRDRLGLGRRAHDRALARAHGAGDLAPARLGHARRSRSRPAATR